MSRTVARSKQPSSTSNRVALKCKRAVERIYLSSFGHKAYQPFVVVGHARTGSNFLTAGLRSSSRLRMHGEIFAGHNRQIGNGFDRVFSHFHRKERRRIKAAGFKLFYYHLTPNEWDRFLSYEDFAVIHLTRKNRLRTIVSLDIAFNTGRWMSSDDAAAQSTPKRVALDTATLIGRLERIRRGEALARKRFRDRRVLELTYEDLVANPVDVFRRVGDFLAVDDIDTDKIALTRQNPESLRQLIVNYAEVHRLLANTPFGDCLSR